MLPIILNLCLGVFKYICGSLSGLASIAADAANNLTDAATSLMTALGVKAASTLGGTRHENGHGRIEWVVGIVVSSESVYFILGNLWQIAHFKFLHIKITHSFYKLY